MKTIGCILVLSASLLFAGGNTVAYQGIFLDSNGAGVALRDSLRFKLFVARTGGASLWEEVHYVQAKNGVFAVGLGSKNPLTKNLFACDSLFLEISKGYVPGPRIKIGSYVYAFRAFQADTAIFAASSKTADSATTAGSLQGRSLSDMRMEIMDSITSHPQVNPATQIGDSLIASRAVWRAEMGDTAALVRAGLRQNISDTLAARFNQGVKSTDNVTFAGVTAPLTGSLNTNNGNIVTGTGDIVTDSVDARVVRAQTIFPGFLRLLHDSALIHPQSGKWTGLSDSTVVFFGDYTTYFKRKYAELVEFSAPSMQINEAAPKKWTQA